jgi:transcriptional regulator with XRE-family HTH domain
MTTAKDQLMGKLQDPEYRKQFQADSLRTALAMQIKEMRKGRDWTQQELGEHLGKPQAVVSRLENPDYGRFSLTSLEDLANAFDVKLYVRFVRYSKWLEWATTGQHPDDLVVPSFDADYASQTSLNAMTDLRKLLASVGVNSRPHTSRQQVSRRESDNNTDGTSAMDPNMICFDMARANLHAGKRAANSASMAVS